MDYWRAVPHSNNYVFRYTTSSDSKKNGPEVRVSLVENRSRRSARIWRLGIVPSALLVLISVGLLLRYNDERRAIPKASQGHSINMEVSKPTIGGRFKLINYEENPVTDSDFCGNWTLIYFGYTSSPDIDPDEVQKMAKVVEILETKENMRINAVFLTIDPFRDTPSHLRAYLREFHPRIMGLTGPENVLRQVAQEFRVFFKKTDVEGPDYLIDCSHDMYLMNPNMGFARVFGLEYNAEQLAYAITSEVKKISKAM
ncbi:protein SCO1 homolog 2, mitochondrial [Cryptomeria japonica]|uniref:protein SCO1 homolog 2, mitochondrial n=1 Tax=Cryptomeria japonica TaxID=3369 RepID=UPI0027DA2D31|nr:protein SCO1 homolog 2, mitochondrial [Cryptomeria japonica]